MTDDGRRMTDVRCSVFGVRCLVFGVRCSVFGVRCSYLCTSYPSFDFDLPVQRNEINGTSRAELITN